VIAQVANILFYLGPRLKLSPRDEANRLWLHQLQLTVTDFVKEVHDTHHPVSTGQYYEDQKPEAKKYAQGFSKTGCEISRLFREGDRQERRSLRARPQSHVCRPFTVPVDRRLRYAFPKAMTRIERKVPNVVGVHDRVAKRPGIKKYLASKRRIAFNEDDIFRHYAELDN